MKIDSKATTSGQVLGKCCVEVTVEFNSPADSMRMSVVVPDQGSEPENKKLGMARAKSLAREFSEFLN